MNRISFSAAIIAASVLVHLGFVGAIVLAERRHLPPSDLQAMDVDLVRPEELESKRPEPQEPPEPPKQKPPQPQQSDAPKSEPSKSEPARSEPARAARAPEPDQAETPPEPKAAKPAKPDLQGGPAGEGKSKLTPEEIASLRAQIQKCWKLPVGIPGMLGLEVILRVSFGSKGQLAGAPVLLQAPASERGPMLVGIAMNALKGCYPYKLPPAKYADWKTLDLKFTATGMAGLGSMQKPPPQARR